MHIYKFGGASIADAGRMKALLPIIQEGKQPLLLVLSALGKTTNALEEIVKKACSNDYDIALNLVTKLKQNHLSIAGQILNKEYLLIASGFLEQYFIELERAVTKADRSKFDFSYDQIVCMGEIFSSCIFSFFLTQEDIPNTWIDARSIIRTDYTYRDATVNWELTQKQALDHIGNELNSGKTVITQGFIGSTASGSSVTLGREGSDYTAAILAAMLQMESVTIWKDVEGFQNADPKQFSNTVKIEAITYNEVIEMAYYGAQIIHAKTIKPLQNNNIPLYVKCFLDRNLTGTVIKDKVVSEQYPPLIVLKENQVLLQVTTRDFSFISEDNLSSLYAIFHQLKIKVNIIQNAAISFVTCIDNREDKVKALISKLTAQYKVLINENVSLLTIRHYNNDIFNELTEHKQILLRQQTRKTLQVVLK